MAIQALDLSGAPTRRAGVFSGSAAGTAPLPKFRVVWSLRLALALMVVAQLGRIPVLAAGGKDAPLLINDLLVILVVVSGALAALRNRRFAVDSVAGWALAFASIGAISAILAIPRFGLSAAEFLFSIAYLVRWLTYFAVYLVTINFVRSADLAGVLKTLEGAVLAFSMFGIFQSLFLPGFAQMVYPDSAAYLDWDPQGHRLVSSFLDPNFAGALIAMTLLLALGRMAFGIETERWKLFVLFVALGLTVSRGAVIGFMAGMFLILRVRGLSRGFVRFIVIGTMFLLIALPLLIQYAIAYNKLTFDASAMTRVVGWITGLEVFSKHPIIGVGFNTYGFVQAKLYGNGVFRASFGLDGGLLFVAVLTGVVGVALYSGMIVAAFARCRRIWRNDARPVEDRALALGVAALTVGIIVHSFFLNTLFYPFLMEPLWVLWALTLVVSRREVAQPPVAISTPLQIPLPASRVESA